MIQLSVKPEIGKTQYVEYISKLDKMSIPELVKELFTYIEYKEGDVHPISISCSRVMMQPGIEGVLHFLKLKSEAA
jgi:hypothetical protein